MTTATLTLTDFLLARIDDDEACVTLLTCECGEGVSEVDPLPWCPDRVLAESEAKRRIVEMHSPYSTPQKMVYGTITACETCGSVDDAPVEWPCETVRALATIYSDHPDYNPAWRP